MWCNSCHVITPPTQPAGSNGVPTFSAVARRPPTTPTSLQTSVLRPLRDLIARILSLRGH
jgi:hypothetical protein